MASRQALEAQVRDLNIAMATVNDQMKRLPLTSPEWQTLNRECADLRVRRNEVVQLLQSAAASGADARSGGGQHAGAPGGGSTMPPRASSSGALLSVHEGEVEAKRLLATNREPIFLRMLNLVDVHRSSKAYVTYKKIKAQLLQEFPAEVFDSQKMAIQIYLKFMSDSGLASSSSGGSSASMSSINSHHYQQQQQHQSQHPEWQRQNSQASHATANSYRSVLAADIPQRQGSLTLGARNGVGEGDGGGGGGHRGGVGDGGRGGGCGGGRPATSLFESIDDFIDYLARVTKVPLARALEIISMDLRLNGEAIFRPHDATRAAEALLAHRLNEQIDILISCGVAGDELQAKEVLEPIAARHAELVMAELRATFSQHQQRKQQQQQQQVRAGEAPSRGAVGGGGGGGGGGAAFASSERSLQSAASSGGTSSSSSSRSLLSNTPSPNESPGASYRHHHNNSTGNGSTTNTTTNSNANGTHNSHNNSSNSSSGGAGSDGGDDGAVGSTGSTGSERTDWAPGTGGGSSSAANSHMGTALHAAGAKQFRHSSPHLNSTSSGGLGATGGSGAGGIGSGVGPAPGRGLEAQRSALAAMQVARLRASGRSQSAMHLTSPGGRSSNSNAAADGGSGDDRHTSTPPTIHE